MTITILHDEAVSPNLVRGERHVTCVYAATATAGDSVVCLYRSGESKHSHDGVLMLQQSADFGKTWSVPRSIFDGTAAQPRETAVSAGLCSLGGDRLLMVVCSVMGLESGTFVFGEEGLKLPRCIRGFVSVDGGRTWESSAEMWPGPYGSAGIAGSPFLLGNGGVGIPIEVTLASGAQATALTLWRPESGPAGLGLLDEPRLIASDPTGKLNLCDAHFCRLPDGTLLMLLWTFLQDGERTIHVHRSVSADDGLSWSSPEPTAIEGQVTVPLALPCGLILAATNYRHAPSGNYVWISSDRGQTWGTIPPVRLWDEQTKRIVALQKPWQPTPAAPHEAVWSELGGFAFGTPDLTLLTDGSVLLTYYATLDGITHIRACRFRVG